MKRFLFFAALLTLGTTAMDAQTMAVGFQLGISAMTDDSFSLDSFDDEVKEIWIAFDTDGEGTVFKLKAGELDSNDWIALGAPGITDDGSITYIDAIVEYRFSEVFGSSAIFAGLGGYRQKFGTYDESDFGGTVGVNALFPVNRRFGITGEVAYHFVDFDVARKFLMASAGVRFNF
jgi:hypothetical protein